MEDALKFVNGYRTAIDIGAHIGTWTVPMSASFDKVFAFEVAQDTYQALIRNTHDCDNVLAANLGVGDYDGECSSADDPTRQGNTGSRFISRAGDSDMVRLDSFLKDEDGPVDFMKIDVEGFEYRALLGAVETIKRYSPVNLMETDKKFAQARYGDRDNAAEELLSDLGYKPVWHKRPDKVFVRG